MPIPPQKVVLTIPVNKRQLTALTVEDLCKNTAFPELPKNIRRLVVTGEEPVPVEIQWQRRFFCPKLRFRTIFESYRFMPFQTPSEGKNSV